MENNNGNGLVKIKSQKLLKIMATKKMLGLLAYINLDNDMPVYTFIAKPDVLDIYNSFVKLYGKDDHSIDNREEWKYWNAEIYKDLSNQDTIVIRSYTAVTELLNLGYGSMLMKTYKNSEDNMKCFVFLASPKIIDIKNKYEGERNI